MIGAPAYAHAQLAAFFAQVRRRVRLPHTADGAARRDEAQGARGQANMGLAPASSALDVALHEQIAGALREGPWFDPGPSGGAPHGNEWLPRGTPSPGERVAGEDGSNTRSTEDAGAVAAVGMTERLLGQQPAWSSADAGRRDSGEGGPPASPAAANMPSFPPTQLGLLGGLR